MTANEMRFSWRLKLDALFDYSAPAYNDAQISNLLTNAQLRIFKHRYNPLGNKYRKGFEFDEQRRVDLEQFIKGASISNGDISVSSNQDDIHPNGVFYDMPSDFLIAIEENAILTGSGSEVDVLPVQHDFYNKNKNNPYKKPYSGLVWRMDFSRLDHGEDGGDSYTGRTAKRIELISDGTLVSDYRVRYLVSPPNIVVDVTTPANQRHCILDKSIHDDIVDEAIRIVKGMINPQEYQIGSAEAQQSE